LAIDLTWVFVNRMGEGLKDGDESDGDTCNDCAKRLFGEANYAMGMPSTPSI
jgi:hypothetical protein